MLGRAAARDPVSLQLSRADGVTQETAFRDLMRSLFLRLPDRALTPSAHALSSSALTRLDHHAPREWERMLLWERWRSLTSATATSTSTKTMSTTQ